MQKTTSQTTTASTDTAKKGKKKNVAAADTIDAEPNNSIEFLPEMFVAEMQRRQLDADKQSKLSINEFLQQLRQSNDIDRNYLKVWTHNMVSSWSVSMAEGDGATLFAVHEQYALLIVFYVLCEYIKMNVNTTPPVSLEDFFDWISERIVKLGQNFEQNLWNCLLGFLNEEANQMANDEPSMSALSGAKSLRAKSRCRVSSIKMSEARIRFGNQMVFFEDLFRKTFRFTMHFEMLRQMASVTRGWSEMESFDHRLVGARPYWAKESAKKSGKKSARLEVAEPPEPNVPPVGSAVELLNEQRRFILPLAMAEEIDQDFFRILVEGPPVDAEEKNLA